jgi:hypothetical protein
MTPDERDELIEAAISAHRNRAHDGRLLPSPAWADLTPEDREAAFDATRASRVLEATLDERGLNSTVRAVVDRIFGLGQLGV